MHETFSRVYTGKQTIINKVKNTETIPNTVSDQDFMKWEIIKGGILEDMQTCENKQHAS